MFCRSVFGVYVRMRVVYVCKRVCVCVSRVYAMGIHTDTRNDGKRGLASQTVIMVCDAVCCSEVQCGALWCSVVHCGAVWCIVVQSVAVICSAGPTRIRNSMSKY